MPRTSSTSASSSGSTPRILGRAMAILSLPLTPLSKARAARTLLHFKRRRARRLRHYNYAYVGEYQFSPSGSPLLLPRPPGGSAWRARRRSRARTVLAALLCGGGCGLDGDGGIDAAVLDGLLPLPRALQDERAGEDAASYGYGYGEEEACDGHGEEEEDDEVVEAELEGDDDEEEVDGRAERFIERFYEEMRMQQRRLL